MKKVIFISTALLTVTLFSCKKEESTPEQPATTGGVSAIHNFFSQNGAPTQNFTIDAGTWQAITGSGGTMIDIGPNSFVTQSGQAVTGPVQIELREIFSKKDMILSNAPTTSGGKPLVSGGEVYFSAKQNNQKLKLAPAGYVYASVPTGNNPSYQMREFYSSSLSATDDWDSTTTPSPINVMADTSSSKNYYSFQVDSTSWINCDYFYSGTGPTSSILANVGSSYDTSNCFVFVSFDGLNSAAHCYAYVNHMYSPGSYYTLPIGMSVTFVAISEKNGQYYSCFKPSVITANHNESLTLTATSLSQIKQDLTNLP